MSNFFEIDVGQICEDLIGNTLLFFRENGASIRKKILSIIRGVPDTYICLNFERVTVIDFSCSDEIVVMLQENVSLLEGKILFLRNLTKSHMENIVSALDNKKQVVWYFNGEGFTLLGSKLPKYLKDILEKVNSRKRVYARQIADELNEEIQSVSLKLKQLFKHGIVRREEEISTEGKQFAYISVPNI